MNLERLTTRRFPTQEQRYDAKDTILYALGVGAGRDPLAPRELPFVYESDLRIVPSQASVLAYPGFWLSDPDLNVDWVRLLHGEQAITFERPLPPTGVIKGDYEVIGVDDKGEGKGAVVYFEKRLLSAADELICRVRSTYFLRGDGGCGSWGEVVAPPSPLPEREPDVVIDQPTGVSQALIYRLNGDYNPVHIDPAVAGKAGFPAPILHGLCTFGVVCYALVQHLCAGNPDQLKELSVRFSRPVFPGETIQLELYLDGPDVRFRARVKERDEIVLDRGLARIARN
jgi:acyl dehydratase